MAMVDAPSYPVASLLDELKNDDIQRRLNSVRRLPTTAKALGEYRTRNELIPLLSEIIDDDDEVLLAMADEMGVFVPYVGGVDHAHVLLPPLESLCTVEETVVRDKAVESLCKIGAQMKERDVVDWFIPLVKRLGSGEWFTARVSACGLFHIAYPSAPDPLRAELRSLYNQLCHDDTSMVRRAASLNLGKFASTVELPYLKSDMMTSFRDRTQEGVASLPTELQRNYMHLQELDQQFQSLQEQMQQRCAQGLDEVMKAVEGGGTAPDTVALHYSTEIGNAHKACLDIADEKVALAVQTYDLVDSHIQRLDKDLKKFEEEIRRDREAAGGGITPSEVAEGVRRVAGREGGEGTMGGRKKGQVAPTNVNMDLDLPVDPNEPTYCYCTQVSYGEMIACDNPECKIEWFHFDCVGIKKRPKGKWYCTDCSALMKRRRAKVPIGGKVGHQTMRKVTMSCNIHLSEGLTELKSQS